MEGSPTLALKVGTGTRLASLFASGGTSRGFRYEVQAGNADADGISILADALALDGGSIRSLAGTDAALDLGSHAIVGHPKHKVDGSKVTAPEIRGIGNTSRPQDGTAYGAGEEIVGYVVFSAVLRVTGSPTLAVTVGDGTRRLPLKWNGQRALFFRYEVKAGDADADGISILEDALALDGGSIRSLAGADASLDLGSHAIVNDAGHKVDGDG